MAYPYIDDKNFIPDLLMRKEFYWTKRWDTEKKHTFVDDIIPRFLMDDAINAGGYLKLVSHQQFTQNFMNPNTDYKRLHVKWSTGSGKTLAGLSIAMNFIENYRLERDMGNAEIGSVFIIGFSEKAFKSDLLKFPEFGFLSRDEKIKLDKLKRLAARGGKSDMDKYRDMVTKIKKRFSSRKGNGFFKFYGYKAFVNRIFVTDPADKININEMSEEQIRLAIINGKITYNTALLNEFKNSLIISDEIHNVYNSSEKNNWGIALQAVLDKEPTVRFLSLSATPFNNSPTEVVDLLNLLLPADKRVSRSDFFINDRDLKPGALEKIAELYTGRISFLIDVNPKYYPKMITEGESLKEIPYLKFIRCKMSDFQYKTYKSIYTGALSQDSQYLVDFAIDNPEDDNIGIFQTSQIKKLLPTASQKWKDKHGLDFIDGKITGDALHIDRLPKISAKYAEMYKHIMDAIKNGHGKIFIYHNVVHMSGVLFAEQVLLRNGFLDEYSSSNDNTVCMRCGKTRKEHSSDEITGSFETNTAGGFEDNGIDEVGSAQDRHLESNSDDDSDSESNSDDDSDAESNSDDDSDDDSEYEYSPPVHTLDIGDTHILDIHDFGTRYNIAVVHNDLLKGDPKTLDAFEETISHFTDKPLYIKISNALGKPLGTWLMAHHFDLDIHTGKHSILVRPASENAIGGTVKKKHTSPKKSNKKDKVSHAVHTSKHGHAKHRFTPARFVMAHSDIDKATMEHSLEKFNNPDNVDGSQYLILIGSKIIKESYDLKAIQNLFVMGRPDNIPTFIQIRGRAVRKNSHKGLPPENHVVRVKIFTTCLPVKQETGLDKGEYKLSYEEEKYKEKVAAFQVIQKIEKVIHENAIDSLINHEKTQRNASDDPLGVLPFQPKNASKFNKEFDVSELNLATFNIYHAEKEINLVKTLVKRLFIELSSVWEYKDLYAAVKNPPAGYETEINTHLFTEDNFLIAMDQLTWHNSPSTTEPFIDRIKMGGRDGGRDGGSFFDVDTDINENGDTGGGDRIGPYIAGNDIFPDIDDPDVYGGHDEAVLGQKHQHYPSVPLTHANHPSTVIDHLYDTNDKIVTLPGGQDSVIVPINNTLNSKQQQFYILFPINYATGTPDIDIELPYRIVKQEEQKVINMNSFIQTKRIDFDYDDKRRIFYRKYVDIAIENMENVICEYGATFHMKFLEECIEYVFNAWTSPNLVKAEYHEFYFKMLYYYDLLSLVMWAYTTKPRVFKEYTKYAIPVKAKDVKLKAMAKYEKRPEELADISPEDNSDLATSGVINLLKSTYNRTSNAWIPQEFREQYNKTVQKSLDLFIGKKKRAKQITKTPADLLPIGHYISKFPRVYHPEKGWDDNPTYLQNETSYVESNVIIGFDERSSTGVHIRFKIRNPIHNIKKHKDSRLTEKGTVCKSKSKSYLRSIAEKLDVIVPDKVNVEELCMLIRSKLIRLELKERIAKTKKKWFYFHYEQKPEDV
jgi:superfamily II DNA or RNA helicase